MSETTNREATKQLLRKIGRIPSSDYRVSAKPIEKPTGMLQGGIELIEKFAEMSFNGLKDLGGKPYIAVDPRVQLYLVNNNDYIGSTAMAVFPLSEPKYVGIGSIYLGRYLIKQEKTELVLPKIRKAELFFKDRKNPSQGYIIEIKDSPHRDERFYALYVMKDPHTRLVQFGTNQRGWFVPISDSVGSFVSFVEEESSLRDGIDYIILRDTKHIFARAYRMEKKIRSLGIKLTDDIVPQPSNK